MCLYIIDKKVTTKRRTGYKVGWKDDNFFLTGNQSAYIPYDEWVTDENTIKLEGSLGGEYEAGFHIFLSKASATNCNMLFFGWDVVKVEFRDVVVTGKQCVGYSSVSVVVAKTIRIKKE